jgi:hypothetical protein
VIGIFAPHFVGDVPKSPRVGFILAIGRLFPSIADDFVGTPPSSSTLSGSEI